MMFSRRQRGYLPTLPNDYEKIDSYDVYEKRKKTITTENSNGDPPEFKIGNNVLVQIPISKTWDTKAVIKDIRDHIY
uniref:Putative LOC100905314 [Metaseiulus occidentalis] n=1 Tax=Lepeophtheirus salmonis TaxID=72036 RepID=A0A0K2T2X2_LEPSM